MTELKPVIGLEVHAELQTRSKMFCACAVVDSISSAPNTAVCEICTGLPGTLPAANARAVEFALRVALALHAVPAERSIFARKNYFYPDSRSARGRRRSGTRLPTENGEAVMNTDTVGRSCVQLAVLVALASGCAKGPSGPDAPAAGATPPAVQSSVAPTVEQLEAAVPENPLKDAYFGETHVHTSYSLDANIGGARITPDEAYRFAKGHDVTVNGQKHNIGRPLDWVAVSDHAEFIGEMYSAQVPGAKGGDHPMLEELRNLKTVDEQRAWFLKYVINNMRGANPSHPPFWAGRARPATA